MNYIKRLAICCAVCVLGACSDTEIEQDGSIVAGFSAKTATFYENAAGNVIVQLSAPAPEDIIVKLAVQNEVNVKEDKDYILPSKEVLILKGRNSAQVEIDFIDDKIMNNSRSFELILTGAQGLTINKEMEKIQIILLDDESDASVIFTNPEFSLRENQIEGVIVPMLFEGTQSDDIFVTVAVKETGLRNKAIEGQHFTIENKEMLIAKGTTDFSKLGIKILPKDDSEINESRVFVLEITKIVGATKITEKSTCVIAIKSDDLGLSWGTSKAVVEERPDGRGVLKLPLRLLGDAIEDLHITVAIEGNVTEGEDYIITSKNVVIPVGQDSVEVELLPVYDNTVNPDKPLKIKVTEVTGYDDLAGIGCDVTILNYDTEISFGKTNGLACSTWEKMNIPMTLSVPVHHSISLLVTGKNATADMPDITVVIPAGATSAQLPLSIFPDNGGQVYDFQIAPISGIIKEHCTATYALSVKIPELLKPLATSTHEQWSIAEKTSDNPGDGGDNSGMAAAAIDENEATYWHSQWSGGGSVLPQHIVIDLKGEVALSQITVAKRMSTSNSDTKLAEIYVSDNVAGPWNKVGTMTWPQNANPNYARSLDVKNCVARYLKINVTEGYRNFAQISEVKLMGSYK